MADGKTDRPAKDAESESPEDLEDESSDSTLPPPIGPAEGAASPGGPSIPAAGGSTPSGGGVTTPNLVFGGSTTQTTTDFVSLFVTCSQACTTTFGGTVTVPGASKVYRLSTLSTTLRAGVRTKVTIRFPAKVRTAVRKAISRRKRVTLSLRIGTRNSAGLSRTSTRRIVIRHR